MIIEYNQKEHLGLKGIKRRRCWLLNFPLGESYQGYSDQEIMNSLIYYNIFKLKTFEILYKNWNQFNK